MDEFQRVSLPGQSFYYHHLCVMLFLSTCIQCDPFSDGSGLCNALLHIVSFYSPVCIKDTADAHMHTQSIHILPANRGGLQEPTSRL